MTLKQVQEGIVNSQVWKSIFRVGIPNTNRKRVLAVLGSLILHLHPVKVRRSGVRMSYTWCMGGTSFFLFLVETVTGLLLGYAADAVLGDPRRGHPVAGFGTVAGALERRVWAPSRARGAAYAGLLVGAAALLGEAAERLA